MENYFGAQGYLSRCVENYQQRDGQLEMAKAIHANLAENHMDQGSARLLLVEAETGIGKTLAYLLPAVLSEKRLVVSTATINLQDQILGKELPILEKILAREIAAVCVKGRQNYLCMFRWYQYRSSQQLSLLDDEFCDLIDEWLLTTATGDRAELPWLPDNSPLWPKISAKPHQCLGSECPESSHCFINELRKKAGGAQLVIVNHHLFFSDLVLRKHGHGEVLPRYEGVIFDEAHHLENIASTFFGKSFSQYQVVDLAGDIERQAQADLPPSTAEKMTGSARGLKERVERFGAIFPEERGRFSLLDFIEVEQGWYDEVKNLSTGLERIIGELEKFEGYGEGWGSLLRRAEELQNNLIEIGLPEVVYEGGRQVHWYERKERSFALSVTPVSVAENLRETLYPAVNHCIMTSATLTAGGDFSYVRARLGLDEDVESLHLRSPFDYQKRCCIYVPENSFPLPAAENYAERLNLRIFELLQITRGRALVLCTSFKAMTSVADYLQQHLPFPILVQGSGSKQALLQEFRDVTDSVLVAVASFWEGVDVRGESLSCVVIDKLPFEVPSDPVLQARVSDIRDSGGNPFFDFQVPRAILTLRQGVGRLMRAREDYGVIAVMDGRLYTKGYGRNFRSSLPPTPIYRDLNQVSVFFDDLVSSASS